jgi:hypothetical protein
MVVASLWGRQWDANCAGELVFTVERSYDGINFEDIGMVNAKSPDCSGSFDFTDNAALTSVSFYYYRLKMISGDASTSYSKTILLSADKDRDLHIVVEPNPVRGSAIHALLSAVDYGSVELFVSDVTGRVLLHQFAGLATGSNAVSLDAGMLSAGIYFLYGISAGEKTNVIQFEKQ